MSEPTADEIDELGETVEWDPKRFPDTSANGSTSRSHTGPNGVDVFEFLNTPEPEHDWLIPGLLERMDRVIITAGEGAGKSTLERQIGVKSTAGIHPFTDDQIDPLRVLLVDLENSSRQVRRSLRQLAVSAGDRLEPGQLTVVIRSEGLDLLRAEDRDWLSAEVDAAQPDLLVGGPLYKMASGDSAKEEVARPVSQFLDELRTRHGLALIIEGHSPYGAGNTKRPERPFGSSLWSRWPEFGIHLSTKDQLRHWRGPRDERAWPAALKRGGTWPFTVQTDTRAITFARILEAVQGAAERLTVRELADRLGLDRNQIQRAIDTNRAQWDAVLKDLD